MSKLKTIPDSAIEAVLLNSKRKCCVCFNTGDTEAKTGTIVALNTSDESIDNYVFLCEDHHKSFDMSKIASDYIKELRDKMLAEIGPVVEAEEHLNQSYESEVAKVLAKEFHELLRSSFSVQHRAYLMGVSGVIREVDILVQFELTGIPFRLIAEVKMRNRPISVQDIDAFASTMRDVLADKGIFITPGNVTQQALNLAHANRITLMRIKPGSKDIVILGKYLDQQIYPTPPEFVPLSELPPHSRKDPIDYSSYLREPPNLKRSAIVEYTWRAEQFRLVLSAAEVRDEPWETGDIVSWLYCKGFQIHSNVSDLSGAKNTMTFLIPAAYVTSIENGPTFRIQKTKKTEDIGVFPPIHPAPPNALSIQVVKQRISTFYI